MLTNAEAAAEFRAALARRGTKGRLAMRYKQMDRIATMLEANAADEWWDDDLRGTLGDLNAIQLMMIEMWALDKYEARAEARQLRPNGV